ncbi:hypothetical protein B0H13DRAFT_1890304 [Mycena leptocephala]|nr:hypothetical protein B0H13DRAFT_1890304 [Mycena leptocephala]
MFRDLPGKFSARSEHLEVSKYGSHRVHQTFDKFVVALYNAKKREKMRENALKRPTGNANNSGRNFDNAETTSVIPSEQQMNLPDLDLPMTVYNHTNNCSSFGAQNVNNIETTGLQIRYKLEVRVFQLLVCAPSTAKLCTRRKSSPLLYICVEVDRRDGRLPLTFVVNGNLVVGALAGFKPVRVVGDGYELRTKIDSDEDIAGKRRSGLNGGDWLVANK